ncbi:hypothetical protein NVP2275O_465 [Vibrio phage 2.275.O._10N.286.54.E11]|nr:hypothetical protein NVP2275O_465 [Vibrio phage 2.275.O._10N.286.54.E11]
MQDILRDVVRSTNGFGFEVIKITATDEGCTIEAVNGERTVIMKGKTKAPVAELTGTFGISNLGFLNGMLNLPTYQESSATVSMSTNANNEPEEIVFKNGRSKSVYRLMAERAIVKQPNFKAPAWDVESTPTVEAVKTFKAHASVFGAISARFKPEVQGDELVFNIGDSAASNHSDVVVFSETDATGLKGGYEYPIDKVQTALGMCANADVELKFSEKGVAQIDVDTGLLELSFVFPGHA